MTREDRQKIIKSNTSHNVMKTSNRTLVSGGGRSSLNLTTDIIKSAKAARQANQLLVDDDWIQKIWKWADKFGITEDLIPRDRDALLALTSLYIRNNNLSELPDSIGQLTNLRTLNIGENNLSKLPDSISQLRLT